MQNRNINKNASNEAKGKVKGFWKKFGIFMLSLFVAVITVLVLNLNR